MQVHLTLLECLAILALLSTLGTIYLDLRLRNNTLGTNFKHLRTDHEKQCLRSEQVFKELKEVAAELRDTIQNANIEVAKLQTITRSLHE